MNDPAAVARRRAQRAAARRLHPDAGGSSAAMAEALAAIDRGPVPARRPSDAGVTVVRSGGPLRRVVRKVAVCARRVATGLRRRRYIELHRRPNP